MQLEEDATFHYVDVSLPHIALIPGNIVIEKFGEESVKHLVISLTKEQLLEDPWKNYFGLENISTILKEGKKQQEKDEEILEATRRKTRNESDKISEPST